MITETYLRRAVNLRCTAQRDDRLLSGNDTNIDWRGVRSVKYVKGITLQGIPLDADCFQCSAVRNPEGAAVISSPVSITRAFYRESFANFC